MILYFSGTGNSEYTAKRIGREIQDEVMNLFEKIRDRDFSEIHSDSPWVLVTPTYAWRIPRLVQEWMENTEFTGCRDIYYVMTCGGSIGNADRYLEKLSSRKNLNDMGCRKVLMPENYIAMFSSPSRAKSLEIIRQAEETIDGAARSIKSRTAFDRPDITLKDRMNSGIVNDIFYPAFVHAKKFYAEDSCISCGKCVKVCPLNNIRLEKGRPQWGNDCTHCMACINRCPTEAIEYGKHTKGKTRYVFPKHHEHKSDN